MSFHLLRTVFWLIPAITVYTIVLGTMSLASTVLGLNRGTLRKKLKRYGML